MRPEYSSFAYSVLREVEGLRAQAEDAIAPSALALVRTKSTSGILPALVVVANLGLLALALIYLCYYRSRERTEDDGADHKHDEDVQSQRQRGPSGGESIDVQDVFAIRHLAEIIENGGASQETTAAIKIQATLRGKWVRTVRRQEETAATKIQASFRGQRARRQDVAAESGRQSSRCQRLPPVIEIVDLEAGESGEPAAAASSEDMLLGSSMSGLPSGLSPSPGADLQRDCGDEDLGTGSVSSTPSTGGVSEFYDVFNTLQKKRASRVLQQAPMRGAGSEAMAPDQSIGGHSRQIGDLVRGASSELTVALSSEHRREKQARRSHASVASTTAAKLLRNSI